MTQPPWVLERNPCRYHVSKWDMNHTFLNPLYFLNLAKNRFTELEQISLWKRGVLVSLVYQCSVSLILFSVLVFCKSLVNWRKGQIIFYKLCSWWYYFILEIWKSTSLRCVMFDVKPHAFIETSHWSVFSLNNWHYRKYILWKKWG